MHSPQEKGIPSAVSTAKITNCIPSNPAAVVEGETIINYIGARADPPRAAASRAIGAAASPAIVAVVEGGIATATTRAGNRGDDGTVPKKSIIDAAPA
mmetsp:Transcript_11959/g.22167  ORF Transcript_11959/g.22167 Transcript_11959/m.22167 type:complete len:98 (-) Transcript_11959:1948-2241(-)